MCHTGRSAISEIPAATSEPGPPAWASYAHRSAGYRLLSRETSARRLSVALVETSSRHAKVLCQSVAPLSCRKRQSLEGVFQIVGGIADTERMTETSVSASRASAREVVGHQTYVVTETQIVARLHSMFDQVAGRDSGYT